MFGVSAEDLEREAKAWLAPETLKQVQAELKQLPVNLERIVEIATSALISSIDSATKKKLIAFMAWVKTTIPEPQLRDLILDGDSELRSQVLIYLRPRLAGSGQVFVSVLREGLADSDSSVRAVALGCVRDIDPNAASTLLPEIRELLKEKALRNTALGVLRWLGRDAGAAVPAVVKLITSEVGQDLAPNGFSAPVA